MIFIVFSLAKTGLPLNGLVGHWLLLLGHFYACQGVRASDILKQSLGRFLRMRLMRFGELAVKPRSAVSLGAIRSEPTNLRSSHVPHDRIMLSLPLAAAPPHYVGAYMFISPRTTTPF